MNIYRHGDVLIKQIEELPRGETKKVTSQVLAWGEVTGHHHTLSCAEAFTVMQGFNEQKYFELTEPATLTHQEHHALTIAPGAYEIVMEREHDYFNEEMRQVLD